MLSLDYNFVINKHRRRLLMLRTWKVAAVWAFKVMGPPREWATHRTAPHRNGPPVKRRTGCISKHPASFSVSQSPKYILRKMPSSFQGKTRPEFGRRLHRTIFRNRVRIQRNYPESNDFFSSDSSENRAALVISTATM